MAKPELGTKRICPETGRKFYDLNKDPIVSPFTGATYPRSYFDSTARPVVEDDEDIEDKESDIEEDDGAEIISLEEADEETKGHEDIDLGDDEDDVDLGDDDDDTFLDDDEEDDDDVSGMIHVSDDDDEH